MRSLLVLSSTYPRWDGDTEPAFVHFLCKQLASQYQVIVLAPHHPGALRKEKLEGILIYRFRYFFTFAETLAYNGGIISNLRNNGLKWLLVPFFLASQFFHLVLLARKYRVLLIHAHWFIPQGLLAVLGRKMLFRNVRVLSTSHGADLFALRGGFLTGLKRYVARHSDHVTVVSNTMKHRLLEMGCDSETISVQPMGVDLRQLFVPDSRVDKRTDLIFVGRLVEKKGLATLLEALGRLRTDFPALKLAIVGDGPERQALQVMADKVGLARQVEFAGAVENSQVPGWYQSARIAVIPSVIAADGDQEGLGLVAVEALGCGCATVVSDLPALSDVVKDGENGLVFRAGDAGDLATKIRRILDNRELYEQLVRNSSRSVCDRFDWRVVGKSYIEIIERCIGTATHR
jgi:glycosyltransferase involved in cell wall biosynthesis